MGSTKNRGHRIKPRWQASQHNHWQASSHCHSSIEPHNIIDFIDDMLD